MLSMVARRLRAGAPFGSLRWTALRHVDDRLELELVATEASATFWIAVRGGRPRTGYAVRGEPCDALVDGLRAVMSALADRR
jgi:hypothetical protein